MYYYNGSERNRSGHVAQSVTCLATDVSLTADPGVANPIPARSHTFMEIDHEIISMVISSHWYPASGVVLDCINS